MVSVAGERCLEVVNQPSPLNFLSDELSLVSSTVGPQFGEPGIDRLCGPELCKAAVMLSLC